MQKYGKILLLLFILLGLIASGLYANSFQKKTTTTKAAPMPIAKETPYARYPLSVSAMQKKTYQGSDLQIEQTLSDGSNYHQYIVSYLSDGLKINALLTVPIGDPSTGSGQVKPKGGWPVIVFNHGYITPSSYETYPTSGQYATYFPEFSRNGYIVLKPDFRGNGNSQGQPEGAYYSPAYATDALNAIASIKKYKDANPNKIGLWGHSMGGNITLRALVVDSKDIKAAVIWGGVVGTYTDLLNWHDPYYHPSSYELSLRNRNRAQIIATYGTPEKNPTFWNAIDPTNFVSQISAPVQIHSGESDAEVPINFSQHLYDKLLTAGKQAQFYTYPGDNHNISQNFGIAMERSLAFFNTYLKNN